MARLAAHVVDLCVVPFASLPFPPLLFTISVFVLCSRAWVAVRKSRTISSWQVLHSSEPTNSAPGMLGGARIVRFVGAAGKQNYGQRDTSPDPPPKFFTLTVDPSS